MTIDALIDRFERGATLLPYAVGGLTREQERTPCGPGSWSIAEVAVHLLDSDLVGGDRIRRVIAEDGPTLLAYDQDAWAARLPYRELPIAEAAALFAAHRRFLARMLRMLDEGTFSRAGQHTENGRMTLAELVRTYVGHLDHHLRFLYAKRGHLGTALYPRYSDASDE